MTEISKKLEAISEAWNISTQELEKVIRFSIEKENEECASIADQHSSPLVAAKIRARLKEAGQ